MTSLVPVALLGWLAVTLALFASLPVRRAAVAAVVGGTLFLPVGGVPLPGLPDYTKQTAVAGGLLLGLVLFDTKGVLALRPRWFDLPVVVVATVPIATSLSNGLGLYDGISSAYGATIQWAVPYFAGRVCFRDSVDLRDLALGVVVGGLVYVPLCLIEIRLSPQLHTWVYGAHQHTFAQTRRFGGFRPTVFMNHGLMVSLFMTGATVTSAWLWAGGAVKRLLGIPISVVTMVLFTTMILCKSVGATVLLGVGLAGLLLVRIVRTRWLLAGLAVFPALYAALRISGAWSFEREIATASRVAGEVAGGSLAFRIRHESILIDHALRCPWVGWGGWMRNRPTETGFTVVTDGLWVIALATHGVVGLFGLLGTLLLPPWLAARIRPRSWFHPRLAPAIGLAHVLALVAIDMLFNAYVSSIWVFACGGVAGVASAAARGGAPSRGPGRAGRTRDSRAPTPPAPVRSWGRPA